MKKYDYVLVGGGLLFRHICLSGLKQGKKCLVLEKREHILGGNLVLRRGRRNRMYTGTGARYFPHQQP